MHADPSLPAEHHQGRSPRRRRRDLRGAVRVRPTGRDEWLLEALAKMKFLTTTQVAALAFHQSRWSTNKRLRRLFDAGLVRVWVRALARDNVYSLAPAGARLMRASQPDDRAPACPTRLDGNLDHLLAINEVR